MISINGWMDSTCCCREELQ